MILKLSNHKAQSFIEYAAVIIVIAAAIIVAGNYYKRSLQGKYRQAADVVGGGELYKSP